MHRLFSVFPIMYSIVNRRKSILLFIFKSYNRPFYIHDDNELSIMGGVFFFNGYSLFGKEDVRKQRGCYSVMQSNRNTFKFYVVIPKFVHRHYLIWARNGIWNPWSKNTLSYYFQNIYLNVLFICCRLKKSGSSYLIASQWVFWSVFMYGRHYLFVFISLVYRKQLIYIIL